MKVSWKHCTNYEEEFIMVINLVHDNSKLNNFINKLKASKTQHKEFKAVISAVLMIESPSLANFSTAISSPFNESYNLEF